MNDVRIDRRRLIGLGLAGVALALSGAAGAQSRAFASTRISVMVRGTGPDVILIPGVDSSRTIWNGTVAAVPGYRYHLVQLAGFGGTAAGGNRNGPVVGPVAEEIARYIRTTGLRSPSIVGHSMGGTIAMMLAARHPTQVGRIMVVDMLPAPAGLFGATPASLGPLADRLRETLTGSPEGRRMLDSLMGLFGDGPAVAATERSDPDVTANALHDLATIDLTGELPRIAAPITVVYANAQSQPLIDHTYKTAYAGARGAKLIAIPNSGHMVMFDQPARFQAMLREFLKGGVASPLLPSRERVG